MPATDKPAENRLPQAGHPSALRQVFSYLVNIRKLNMGKKDRAREKKIRNNEILQAYYGASERDLFDHIPRVC
ncbi:TPA: hypothetical protein ACFP4Y_001948 [Neisseria bacilliformis]|uniref:hypothetical protein n=1 Tax=Neisseria bacilliformis TaxID=267212 RepID=UPI0028E289F6|nr:hypothetical protein [Neisseria bacilliformis]